MSENETREKPRARREKRRREEPAAVADVVESPAPAKKTRARAKPAPAVSEREEVLAANAVFYRAAETRDIEAMGDTWAKVPHTRCIHPGWEPLCGWDEIVGSWRQIFRGLELLSFELTDISVRMGGGLAWVEVVENLEATIDGKKGRTQVLATNLFERQPDGVWRMIHHHASPVMVRHPAPRRGNEPLH
ncbi:MAG: nuclear transport factor 2 family protein [Stellaceae bacterium]